MVQYRNIVVLTGSGISAESGLKTFRGGDGLWEGHRVEDVATPEAFIRDPGVVQAFYNARRKQLQTAMPNAAHLALAELEKNWPGNFLLVTQNVDDLHERGGSKNILHMHGELKKARHMDTEEVVDWHDDIRDGDPYRPHIVWFGEMPLYMEEIYRALHAADLFVSIGTSGTVYPAAGFVQQVRFYGLADTVQLNLDPAENSPMFERTLLGQATEIVPQFVQELLHSKR